MSASPWPPTYWVSDFCILLALSLPYPFRTTLIAHLILFILEHSWLHMLPLIRLLPPMDLMTMSFRGSRAESHQTTRSLKSYTPWAGWNITSQVETFNISTRKEGYLRRWTWSMTLFLDLVEDSGWNRVCIRPELSRNSSSETLTRFIEDEIWLKGIGSSDGVKDDVWSVVGDHAIRSVVLKLTLLLSSGCLATLILAYFSFLEIDIDIGFYAVYRPSPKCKIGCNQPQALTSSWEHCFSVLIPITATSISPGL